MFDILFGRENLAAFFAALVSCIATGQPVGIHVVGDSKVAGNGVSDGYRIDQLIASSARGYPIVVTYEGFGGQNSYLWANGKCQDFVGDHPTVKLLIVNFGTNERVSSAIGGAQDLAQTKFNHLAAIGVIRQARTLSDLSVLLMGQPPVNNSAGQYSQLTADMEAINGVLLEVALETNCGFFDVMALFQRAHGEAGWMDQLPCPPYIGGNVHPGDAMNLVMMGEMSKRLFPSRGGLSDDQGLIIWPTLQNNWKPWTSPAIDYAPRAVLRGDVVMLEGLIKQGATANYTTLFTLPPGFRPPTHRFFTVSTNNAGAVRQVQVLSSGIVRLGESFAGEFLSLDGVSFSRA
ncbi:hypothetical protein B5K11_09800 [Rhizobium leguminosarum bv. trifolii]|uniref:SGNH/GDSL hydrolase family protein n=1 Tax=Rhizobium leguminosarum TaxID=384 RepID=UPI000E2E4BBC|nr:SGNH/GDSL hydrolase family protein [Rhizobium leguminosarum]RFB95233.1 hypothetical protein B5K11_09800 [Rhizobium leguminosarum bv. trifolii]